MTTFLWWVEMLKPHLSFGEPCSEDTKKIYTALWVMAKDHPQFYKCLKMSEGWADD